MDITAPRAQALAVMARAFGTSPKVIAETLALLDDDMPAIPCPVDAVFACYDLDGDHVAWMGDHWVALLDGEWVRATPGELSEVDQACADMLIRAPKKPATKSATKSEQSRDELVATICGTDTVVHTNNRPRKHGAITTTRAKTARVPRNPIATKQLVDMDGDHVALLPNGNWVVWNGKIWVAGTPNWEVAA